MVGRLIHGRLRWLCRLPLGALRHATASTVPRVHGQSRPPGQAFRRGAGSYLVMNTTCAQTASARVAWQ
jgi:hypothetical protein